MNIFAISNDPVECAKALDDKRACKMLVETGQIVSSAFHLLGHDLTLTTFVDPTLLYNPAWLHHPVVQWTADPEMSNMAWTLQLLQALVAEYKLRYGREEHETARRIFYNLNQLARAGINTWPTPPRSFCNCSEYKQMDDVHLAYKLTLNNKWSNDVRAPRWHGQEFTGYPDWARFTRGDATEPISAEIIPFVKR